MIGNYHRYSKINDVKSLQSYIKRLKIFEYLENKSGPNGILVLQETHSTENENYIRWNDDFNGQTHYSHGKSNSCGVLIAFLGSITYTDRKKAPNKHGRILIIEALIDDTEFILNKLNNASTENDLTTFTGLTNLLENFDLTKNKPIIFAGDFNLFLNRSLEAKGGNPCLKKQSLSKVLNIKKKLNLCDIWRIRNPKAKQYTFF